jgi:hypothetical protein
VLTDTGTPVPPAAPARIELPSNTPCGSNVLPDDHLNFLHSMLA